MKKVWCASAIVSTVALNACTYAIQIPTATEKKLVEDYYSANPSATPEDFENHFNSAELRTAIGDDTFVHTDYRSAEAFCKNVMIKGRDASKAYAGWGWSAAILGAAGTGVLTGLAAKEDDKAGVAAAGGGAALAAAVTAVGVYLLSRSSAADRASGEAASGLQEAQAENEWKKCVEARLHWQDSNAKATDDIAAVFKEGTSKKDDPKKDDPKKDDPKKDDPKKDDPKGETSGERETGAETAAGPHTRSPAPAPSP